MIIKSDILTLSNGMEFMRVPAGKFLMGNDNGDDREKPQHIVDISYDFWMAKYPITNGFYYGYSNAKGISHPVNGWEKKKDHPVVYVNWDTTVRYVEWLNQSLSNELPSNLILRLPTEAEWEKAARGTNGQEFPWGNQFDVNKCNAPSSKLSSLFKSILNRNTTPVKKYSPQGDSPYGCVDMSGNVWEWTHTLRYHENDYPYPYPYKVDDGRERDEDYLDDFRVLRGGSFVAVSSYVRCACRIGRPSSQVIDTYGFRICIAPHLPK